MILSKWPKGVALTSPDDEEMSMWLWFYEWNLFDAIEPGQHTHGDPNIRETGIEVSADGKSARVVYDEVGLQLQVESRADGAHMLLTVTNRSQHSWPSLASIIPCFNPGPAEIRNPSFANTDTFFLGPKGLEKLNLREIHYNSLHRAEIDDEADNDGKYVWSEKWPNSEPDSHAGLMIRESTDRKWVTGIAWDRFLSTQGHNPWECMHLSINVGPLDQGDTREIRGRMYLFEGTKDQVLQRYYDDFGA